MNAEDAIKFMEKTGQCVKSISSTGPYFRLFQNDTICELRHAGPCCATVIAQRNYDEFISEGFRVEFEAYDQSA